jgi:uncharacterized membrane protein YfcA
VKQASFHPGGMAGVLVAVTIAGGLGLAATLIEDDVPVMAALTLSVAVMVGTPAFVKVAEKMPLPMVRVESVGRQTLGSVELNWTVPV